MQNSNINYQALETTASKELQKELTERLKNKDWGADGGFKATVLRLVISGEYETAAENIQGYIASKDQYREFQIRCESYVQHTSELISAIQNKRNLPGMGVFSLSKRQELAEKVLDHFEELKQYLKQIEKVEREVKLADARSTIWVLQALWQGTLMVFVVALLLDLNFGILKSFHIVTTQALDHVSNWFLKMIGF